MLDLTGYLRRLGLEHPGPPSVSGLFAIHRAQVERVAYSTVDIYRGRPPSIDPYESADRVAATGRGGYCYHLNGALSVVLAELGFDIHRHRGFVWSQPEEVPLKPYANHLALTVHGRNGTWSGSDHTPPRWRCTSKPSPASTTESAPLRW